MANNTNMTQQGVNKVLFQTKKLSDGTYERIFSCIPSVVYGVFLFNCILCLVQNIPGSAALMAHVGCKKHQHHINKNYIPNATLYRSQLIAYRGVVSHCAPIITMLDRMIYYERYEIRDMSDELPCGITHKFLDHKFHLMMTEHSGTPTTNTTDDSSDNEYSHFPYREPENLLGTKPKMTKISRKDKFVKELRRAINIINMKYREYEDNPEKHPRYYQEWLKFYEILHMQLLANKIDPRTYNYKPEWVDFWMPRMKKLKLAEFQKKEDEILKTLLPTKSNAKNIRKKKYLTTRTRITRPPIESSGDESEAVRRPSRSRKRIVTTQITRRTSQRISASSEEDNDPINIFSFCSLLKAQRLSNEFNTITKLKVSHFHKIGEKMEKVNTSNNLLMEDETIEFLDHVKRQLIDLVTDDRKSSAAEFALRKIFTLKRKAYSKRFPRV